MMSAQPDIQDDPVASARAAAYSGFRPRGTVRCLGEPLFRSQTARNLGCLLDLDVDVISWTCLPLALKEGRAAHVPDFLVDRGAGTTIEDAVDGGVALHHGLSKQRIGQGTPMLLFRPRKSTPDTACRTLGTCCGMHAGIVRWAIVCGCSLRWTRSAP
jgi:hypothetical protein